MGDPVLFDDEEIDATNHQVGEISKNCGEAVVKAAHKAKEFDSDHVGMRTAQSTWACALLGTAAPPVAAEPPAPLAPRRPLRPQILAVPA